MKGSEESMGTLIKLVGGWESTTYDVSLFKKRMGLSSNAFKNYDKTSFMNESGYCTHACQIFFDDNLEDFSDILSNVKLFRSNNPPDRSLMEFPIKFINQLISIALFESKEEEYEKSSDEVNGFTYYVLQRELWRRRFILMIGVRHDPCQSTNTSTNKE